MTTETSSSEGVTPETGSPVTGTPASSGATPQPKPAATLEEALARIAELEHAHKNATEERDRHRKKLSSYEEAERKAQEAALSEVEKANKRAQEAETQIKAYQQQLVTAQIQLQATAKGIANAELISPYVHSKLEFDSDGKPTNLDKVLDEVIKSNPNLVVNKPDPGTPAAQTADNRRAPMTPPNNPGRSQIVQPGQLQPNQIMRLTDVYKRDKQ